MTSRATSNDVARLAGVDRSTVSIVLKDPNTTRVRPETRSRILEAAAELGYVADRAASQLRKGVSQIALMPLFSLANVPSFEAVVDGYSRACEEHGWTLLIHGSRDLANIEGAKVWAALRPEVVIVETTRLDQPSVRLLKEMGTRIILGIGDSELAGVTHVWPDNEEAGRLAAERLIRGGATSLTAFLPDDPRIRPLVEERLSGAYAEGARHGMPLEVVFYASSGPTLGKWWDRFGERAASRFGIFAYNDSVALEIIHLARMRGFNAGIDFAIVGIDNIEAGRNETPRLTSLTYDPGVYSYDVLSAGIRAARSGGSSTQLPRAKFRIVEGGTG